MSDSVIIFQFGTEEHKPQFQIFPANELSWAKMPLLNMLPFHSVKVPERIYYTGVTVDADPGAALKHIKDAHDNLARMIEKKNLSSSNAAVLLTISKLHMASLAHDQKPRSQDKAKAVHQCLQKDKDLTALFVENFGKEAADTITVEARDAYAEYARGHAPELPEAPKPDFDAIVREADEELNGTVQKNLTPH